jgi:hypothetical protein
MIALQGAWRWARFLLWPARPVAIPGAHDSRTGLFGLRSAHGRTDQAIHMARAHRAGARTALRPQTIPPRMADGRTQRALATALQAALVLLI